MSNRIEKLRNAVSPNIGICISKRVAQALLVVTLCLSGNANAALYYFHNDHLGTPQVVTDTNGDVVWEGRYDPFGEVVETTAAVQQDLRFPGQLLDRETGYTTTTSGTTTPSQEDTLRVIRSGWRGA